MGLKAALPDFLNFPIRCKGRAPMDERTPSGASVDELAAGASARRGTPGEVGVEHDPAGTRGRLKSSPRARAW